MDGQRCRHCGVRRISRPRNLCWRCDADKAARALYPLDAVRQRLSGEQDFCGGYRCPLDATTALPGTAEKMATLARRVALKVALCHQEDARRELR